MATKYRTDSYPYKVYTALLTQTDDDAPTAIVLENTLGGTIVWTYDSVGIYIGTLIGAFTANKTVTIPLISTYTTNDLSGGALIRIGPDTLNTVKINTLDGAFTSTDDILVDSPIEIRVYS